MTFLAAGTGSADGIVARAVGDPDAVETIACERGRAGGIGADIVALHDVPCRTGPLDVDRAVQYSPR